jgi:hypothetical protein
VQRLDSQLQARLKVGDIVILCQIFEHMMCSFEVSMSGEVPTLIVGRVVTAIHVVAMRLPISSFVLFDQKVIQPELKVFDKAPNGWPIQNQKHIRPICSKHDGVDSSN